VLTVPDFVGRVVAVLRANHGGVGRVFVERMLTWQDEHDDRGAAWLEQRRRTYRDVAARRIPSASAEEFARVREVFATIYASARLAIELGVLPWTASALGAALIACETAHVDLVMGVTSDVPRRGSAVTPIDALRRHVEENRASFIDLRKGLVNSASGHEHQSCPGYINRHHRDTLELLFSEDVLLGVCGADQGRLDELKRSLDRDGITRRAPNRYVVRRSIYSGARDCREYVLAVRADAFGVI
jgi:hypothetical protein